MTDATGGMPTASTHLLAEYVGCPPARLDDPAFIEAAMRRAAEAAGATVVQAVFHRFAPQGVSGVVVVEESHLSIHTWPEQGYAAVDVFTCGDCRPAEAQRVLAEELGATRFEIMDIARGGPPGGPMMRVRHHRAGDGPRAAVDGAPAAGG